MSEYLYKVTVIVPVYNAENFLRTSLESLVHQTIDLNDMEVLLIDDGSVDHSFAIMEEYAVQYPCIKVFRKQNEGASVTRNYGIMRASGKYIMYLDADDYWSPETVASVTSFFDAHYDEVDLVTYKELSIHVDGRKEEHIRYSILKHSGVYDLSIGDYAFITQTRMNVCVKNLLKNNILFNTESDFHEDQKYCTEILIQKMKIGYCNKATYFYVHQAESIVRTYFHAYYIFEPTMKYWEELFGRWEPMEVPAYIQALYLNDISWKMRSNILLPQHYSEAELERAKDRIDALLRQVSNEVILRHPGVDNFHRHYFICRKQEANIRLFKGTQSIIVTSDDCILLDIKKIEIVLCSFFVKNDKVQIIAYLKSALFNYTEKPELYLIRNGVISQPENVPLRESSWCHYRSKTWTNNFWLFQVEIDASEVKSFEFRPQICGISFKTYYYFMPEVFFSHELKRYTYLKNGKEYVYSNSVFKIRSVNAQKERNYWKNVRKKYRKKNKKLWLIRNICSLNIKRYENVWLYYDCKGVRKDNGYYQFIHDFGKADGVSRYYVVNDNLDLVRDLFSKEQQKYLVRFGSWFHKFLYLKARKIITAYIEKNNYQPFNDYWYSRYMDVSNQPELIYLQHGVLHAHQPWKYSLDRLCVGKEVISTQYERENLIHNYRFTGKNLISCGMPRYDYIDLEQESVNRILYAPSWRKYLVGREGTEWVSKEKKFLQSIYFAETCRFLNSSSLHDLLEQHDLYLDFKLHPILERYKHLYHITNDRVTLADSLVNDTEYKVFMTDFSSFVFDFVYLQKPILYFLPDDEMFRSGMNDYCELDIPFEKAFGDLALTAEEAETCLKKILENGCQPEQKYAERMKDFFLYKDNSQCDRLYNALIQDSEI